MFLIVGACAPILSYAGTLSTGAGQYVYHDTVMHAYIKVYCYKPKHFSADTPIVFVLHGIKRNAADYRDSWANYAEKNNLMILTPQFPRSAFRGANGYNLGNIYHAVTHMEAIGRRKPKSTNPPEQWAGALIERLFTDFRRHRENSRWKTYFLYGHGAGGQFVAHMMMFMPDARTALAISASSGWYTAPNPSVKWPYGIKDVPPATQDRLKAFYGAPFMLMIGSRDTRSHHTIMRQNKYTPVQGKNRLARAHYFYNYNKKQARRLGVPFNWRIKVVEGVGHRVADMVPAAAQVIAKAASQKTPGGAP
jgi:poly(3-hydroxybutyrate) depolymerase